MSCKPFVAALVAIAAIAALVMLGFHAYGWWWLNVRQGAPDKQASLGNKALLGDHPELGAKFIRNAAESGSSRGILLACYIHYYAIGVPKDFVATAHWCTAASRRNNEFGHLALAWLCLERAPMCAPTTAMLRLRAAIAAGYQMTPDDAARFSRAFCASEAVPLCRQFRQIAAGAQAPRQ